MLSLSALLLVRHYLSLRQGPCFFPYYMGITEQSVISELNLLFLSPSRHVKAIEVPYFPFTALMIGKKVSSSCSCPTV